MANLMTAAQFQRLLNVNLTKAYEDKLSAYAPAMIPALYNVLSSDRAYDEYFDVEALGDIPAFNGTLPYLSQSPGFYTKIEQKEYGAAIQFERKLLDQKQYAVMDNRAGELAISTNRTREKIAVRPFSNAFSSAFDYQSSEEGVALCSTAHLTKVPGVSTTALGGFSNSGTTALSKTSIAAARLAMKRFRMNNGELANMTGDLLIVPSSLYDTACEATGYDPRSGANSELDPDSAQFKVNVARGIKVIEWTYLDDTSTSNWFMVDSAAMKKFLLWIDSLKPEFETRHDFNTKAVEASVYARWANGFTAWQWIYGNNVS
jgi:hypothetical protein